MSSSSSVSPDLALYVAEIEQQCESLLDPAAKLAFVEEQIRDTCEQIELRSLRLDVLVEFVTTKKLYDGSHSSGRAWMDSLEPWVVDAINHSRSNRAMCTDLAMKINQAWDVWPWQLIEEQHQPRVWSRAILDGIHKLSQAGCEKSEAESLLAQARVDRARRDYSDRRMGVTTKDILTKSDVTTALDKYHQSTVEPTGKKRKRPQTYQSTRSKTKKTTHSQIPSDVEVTSPEIETGRTRRESLTNDGSHDGSPKASPGPSSRAPSTFEGRPVSDNPSSPQRLDHTEEPLISKADHSAETPIRSTPEAKHTTGDDGNSVDGRIHEDSNTDGEVPGSEDKSSESVQARNRAVPDNDLSGAVGTLDDRQWLSSTAVELILKKMCCAGIRIFDSSFLAGDGSTYSIKQIGDEKLWILPLLLRGNHWGLVTIEVDSGAVSFWNSLKSEVSEHEFEREACRIVDSLEQFVRTSEAIVYSSPSDKSAPRDRKWNVTVEKCPQQDNEDDCGVYIIVFAIHKIGGLTLPESIDVGLWRQVLSQLLQTGSVVVDGSSEQPEVITSTSDPVTTDDGSDCDSLKVWCLVCATDPTKDNSALTSSGVTATARQISFCQGAILTPDPLNCFKDFQKGLSNDLTDAEKQLRLSADTLQCSKRMQEQVAAFHEQNVRKQQDMQEATQVHRDMKSMYGRLGASSRSGDLDVLLDTELRNCEKRDERQRGEVDRLVGAVKGWEVAVRTCGAVCDRRGALVDSRTKAIREFLDQLREWSRGQRVLLKDLESVEMDMADSIEPNEES